MTKQTQSFTEGKIFTPLIRFALPVLFALFLQTMYGAIDLLIVGQFGGDLADVYVSAVSTGSQVMQALTVVITGLAMGLTVFVGKEIGAGMREKAGKIIGTGGQRADFPVDYSQAGAALFPLCQRYSSEWGLHRTNPEAWHSDCLSGFACKYFVSCYHCDCQFPWADCVSRGRCGGENVWFSDAGSIGLYAVYVCFCGTEYGSRKTETGQKGTALRNCILFDCKCYHGIFYFLPWGGAGRDLCKGYAGHTGSGRLSEGLCTGLSSDFLFVLLYWVFQRM